MHLRTISMMVMALMLGAAGEAHAYLKDICTSKVASDGSTVDICPNGPPNISNNGQNNGNVLAHPEVAPIFWGYNWNSDAGNRGGLIGFLQYFVNGPFLDGMKEYGLSYGSTGGFSKARMSARTPIRADRLSGSVARQDIPTMVNQMIGANLVAPPRVGTDMIYTVFIEPGITVNELPSFAGGFNEQDTCTSDCGAYNGRIYQLAVVFTSDSGVSMAKWTNNVSHEIEEAITQNLTFDCGTMPVVNQIADICECYSSVNQPFVAMQNGLVQPYWSAQQGKCVVPESWPGVMEYNNSQYDWSTLALPQVSGQPVEVVQVATGDIGSNCLDPTCANLVILARGNKVYLYNGDYTWSDISPPSMGGPQLSTVSVGNGWVLGLKSTANQIYRWDPRTRVWNPLASLPGNFTTIASGVFDIVTDEGGNPWEPIGTDGLLSIGTPGDQFVVGRNWAAKLAPGFEDVKITTGNGTWIDLHHAATELYIGGSQALAIRDMTSAEGVLAMTTSFTNGAYVPNPWFWMSTVAQSSFALYGNTAAARLPLAEESIQGDMLPLSSTQYWDWIGPVATHLIGHSSHLWATSNPHY
jgi:hypothetical protein